ncbi:MAG: hypothetical protein ACR2QM_06980, partial [Longimicrobiales bacterium]
MPILFALLVTPLAAYGQPPGPRAHFGFDGTVASFPEAGVQPAASGTASFVDGLSGEALRIRPEGASTLLTLPRSL